MYSTININSSLNRGSGDSLVGKAPTAQASPEHLWKVRCYSMTITSHTEGEDRQICEAHWPYSNEILSQGTQLLRINIWGWPSLNTGRQYTCISTVTRIVTKWETVKNFTIEGHWQNHALKKLKGKQHQQGYPLTATQCHTILGIHAYTHTRTQRPT